ncbi:MAG: P27 family phage terminase small subunit [Christensenellaceae bacterium]|nr:P27 family phage terminase small subunit [Christensenellaceae bacterium]
MARPAKSVNVSSKHLTKEEQAARQDAENKLRGGIGKKPQPPKHLSAAQRKIFLRIRKELEESNILSSLDDYVLAAASVAIDRLAYIETSINIDPELLSDKNFMASKDKYMRDFFRCCNELCLSPQSRAKMAVTNLNAAKEAADPLLEALKGLND